MAFNREAAKAEGYTDEEIDAYLNPAPPVQQPPKDRSEENTGAAQFGAAKAVELGLEAAGAYYGGKKLIGALGNAFRGTPAEAPPTPPAAGPVAPAPAPAAISGQGRVLNPADITQMAEKYKSVQPVMAGGQPAPQNTAPNLTRAAPTVGPGPAAMAPAPTMAPPAAPPVGGPAAQQGVTFLQRMAQQYGTVAQKVAPVLAGASKMIAPAVIAKELFYTSPEERAILQKAEAEKRARGWKPLNER